MKTELIVPEKWAFTCAENIDFKGDGTIVDGSIGHSSVHTRGVGGDMEGMELGRGSGEKRNRLVGDVGMGG